jgi:hypothetical protein
VNLVAAFLIRHRSGTGPYEKRVLRKKSCEFILPSAVATSLSVHRSCTAPFSYLFILQDTPRDKSVSPLGSIQPFPPFYFSCVRPPRSPHSRPAVGCVTEMTSSSPCLSYFVPLPQWVGMHPVHNAWMTRAMLEEMGFQKMIHEVDAQMVAKLGLYNRPLTIAGVQQHLSDFGLEPEFGTYGQIKNLSGQAHACTSVCCSSVALIREVQLGLSASFFKCLGWSPVEC